jgi:hypothetical protein
MVFNTTLNNISAISWRSVLLVGETGENHRPVASIWPTLLHNVVSSTPRTSGIPTHKVIGDRHWLHRGFMFYFCYVYLFTHTDVQHDFHVISCSCRLTVTRRVSHVEQKLHIHLEHISSPPVFSGVRVARFLDLYVMFCRSLFFLLAIVFFFDLRLLITSLWYLRFTASDYPFGILDLRLLITPLVS